MKDVLLSWHGSFVGRIKKAWRERNRRIFESKEPVLFFCYIFFIRREVVVHSIKTCFYKTCFLLIKNK